MPLHEYRCRKCGTLLEKIQKFSDPPLKKCEKCGGKLERLLSSSAIQFKGSGWYVTDYARKSPAAATKSDGSSDSEAKKAEPAADSKKETKPPAPAESATPKPDK